MCGAHGIMSLDIIPAPIRVKRIVCIAPKGPCAEQYLEKGRKKQG